MSNLRSFFLFFVRNEIGWSRRRKKREKKMLLYLFKDFVHERLLNISRIVSYRS